MTYRPNETLTRHSDYRALRRVALVDLHPGRFCGACGEREGSTYAKPCCTDDQMIIDVNDLGDE